MKAPRVSRFCQLFFVALFSCSALAVQAQLFVDAETGIVYPGSYNNIRQPAQGGTPYNAFGSNFQIKPVLNLRGRLGYTVNDRHTFFVTVAPLLIKSVSKAPLAEPVRFEDLTIPAGQTLTTRYKFNGYRLTYRYNFIRTEKLRLAVGLTGNIRDAYIEVSDGTQTRRFSDLGIVPLLNVYANFQPGRLGLLLEGDGLVSPYGRAEDFFGGLTYALAPKTKLKAGYRILEGGGDSNNFYNFSIFHTLAVGVQIGL
ncbi:hypothetical protein GCM10023189_60890 [Nibrella saemangeumensis]|uniref:Outer membrane protein beta-barrel domain-containing protein n=1 Tax=Nibrella saemangeumensis TaxID=1084526 RepID=A0ABP8NSN4_9BACT